MPVQAGAETFKATVLVLGVLVSLFIASIGLYFDLLWHQNFPFETFWTPAHGALYGGVFATALLLLLTARIKDWSPVLPGSQAFRLPGIPGYPLPLLLAVVGTATVLIAGALDQRWHSILGGGESAFSWPHNLALSGGVILGVSVVSVVIHARESNPRLALVGWALWSIGWPIVLFRYLGSYRFSEAEILEMVGDEILASDPAWLHIASNVVEYNMTANNVLIGPPLTFLVAGLFLYVASSLHPLGGQRPYRLLAEAPASTSALLYVSGIFAVNMALIALGYRALFTQHILASLIALGVAVDLSKRLGLREPLTWLLAPAIASIPYSLLLSYAPPELIIALLGALIGCLAGVFAGKYTLKLARGLDSWGILALLIVIVALPLVLGTLDSFLRYETWYFPPRP